MKNNKTLGVLIPLALLATACGNNLLRNDKSAASSTEELNVAEESDELVADQVSALASDLSAEDATSTSDSGALGLAIDKNLQLEKSCSASGDTLTLKRNKSIEKESSRSKRAGQFEKSMSSESSFEHVYKAGEGKALPVKCQTERGPVKFLRDNPADYAGLTANGSSSRSHSIELKKDGVVIRSRSSEHSGSRSVSFSEAVLADEKIIVNKSIAIEATGTVKSLKDGKEESGSHKYKTLNTAPLSVEVVREAQSGRLISKTIKSGHVEIERASGVKIDVIYEMVKFARACEPVAGRLEVIRIDPQDGKTTNLSIKFRDGEAFASKDGAAEEKMESLNFRLEGCRSK
ncbi:MAG: hypothetical protein RLZZ488_2301 [Pseudomonadota bacterium]|jgi:hypothetical protein